MFTEYDKAITALIMAVISIVSLWFGWTSAETVDVSSSIPGVAGDTAETVKQAVKVVQDIVAGTSTIPDVVATASAVLSPLLVWLVPNRRRT